MFCWFCIALQQASIHLLIIQLEMLHCEYTKPFISANEHANVQQMQVE
jgi:hypothetical protein